MRPIGTATGGGPSEALVQACVVGLGAMYDAGLATYGAFPRTAEELRRKAYAYAETLMPIEGDPADPEIDAECVARAVLRLRRESREDGRAVDLPSAGEFRRRCQDAWHDLYRFVGRDVEGPGGHACLTLVRVRRGATRDEVARALAGGPAALEGSSPRSSATRFGGRS